MKALVIGLLALTLTSCGSKEAPPTAVANVQEAIVAVSYCATNDCESIANAAIEALEEGHCGPGGGCSFGEIEFGSGKCSTLFSRCCSNGGKFFGLKDSVTGKEATFLADVFLDEFKTYADPGSMKRATGTDDTAEIKKAILFALDAGSCQ